MIINSAINAGQRHRQERKNCQDCVKYKIADRISSIYSIAAADGCSAAAEAEAAANINCQAAINFFSDEKNCGIDDLDKLIKKFTRYNIRCLEESSLIYSELSATTASVHVKENGDFIAVSLGDCTIVTFDSEFYPSVLCAPQQEIDGYTHFTNEYEEAVRTMWVKKGNINAMGIAGFAIFTDGCACINDEMLRGAEMLREMAIYTAADPDTQILRDKINYITSYKTKDDAAIVFMLTDSCRNAAVNILNAEQERQRLIELGRNSEDRNSKSFSGQAPKYDYILQALHNCPMTAEELVDKGVCSNGKVLSAMKPLVEMKLVSYTGGKFVLSPNFRNI